MDLEILSKIEEANKSLTLPYLTNSRKNIVLYKTIVDIINIYTGYNPDYPFSCYFTNGYLVTPVGEYSQTIRDENLKKFLLDNNVCNGSDFVRLRCSFGALTDLNGTQVGTPLPVIFLSTSHYSEIANNNKVLESNNTLLFFNLKIRLLITVMGSIKEEVFQYINFEGYYDALFYDEPGAPELVFKWVSKDSLGTCISLYKYKHCFLFLKTNSSCSLLRQSPSENVISTYINSLYDSIIVLTCLCDLSKISHLEIGCLADIEKILIRIKPGY